MLNINKEQDGKKLTILLEGRLDTTTAPALDDELFAVIDGIEELTFDMSKLEYISSAGLRSLLSAHKKTSGKGGMKIINASAEVKEIFDITGFSQILTVV